MKARATDAFGELLNGGADVHRCGAARALGRIGGPRSAAFLIQALLDEDPDVRTDAAEALCLLKDPASTDALMENLIGDPEGDVKKAAIRALTAQNHMPLVPILRKLVVSRSDDIVWDDNEFYADNWDSWVDVQLLALQGLATFRDEAAVPEILAAMSDEMGQDLTEPGVAALVVLGQPGAAALEQILDTSSPRLRRQIARAVAAGDNPHLSGLQDRLLADAALQVRLITLGGLDPADSRLASLFDDQSEDIRAAAVRHAAISFAALIAGLSGDPSAKVRAEVFKRIAAAPAPFKSKEVIEAVKAGITNDPEAAKQAALALVALRGPKVAKGLAHALTNTEVPLEFRVGVVEALKKAGPVSIPALLGAAGVPERSVRLAVLEALVDFAANDPVWPNAAGTGLLRALNGDLVLPPEDAAEDTPKDAPENAAENAAEDAAADAPEKAAPAPLTEEEMREIDETLPLAATPMEPEAGASTLASIAAVDPTPVREEAPKPIEMSDQERRFLALSKRRKMSKKKMPLEPAVAPDLDVKRFAARLLGGVVNREVTENLIAALTDEDAEMRHPVLQSLVAHAEKLNGLPDLAKAPLLALVDSTDGEDRVLAVRAFGWLQGGEVDEKLHALLQDEDDLVRLEAVRALGNHDIADAAVFSCLNDRYLGVGIAAATSIARLCGTDGVEALVEFAFLRDGTHRRDIGRMLAKYAPQAGAERLLGVLGDADLRSSWLVAIDALCELFEHADETAAQKAA